MGRVALLLLLLVAACAVARADFLHALRDLEKTEATYLHGLQTMVNMKNEMLTKNFPEGKVNKVFRNTEELLVFSFKLDLALKRFELNRSPLHVCATLHKTFSRLHHGMATSYNAYTVGHNAALVAFNSIPNKRWDSLSGGQQSMAELSSLLITPVQRLPRYILLLKDIYKGAGAEEGTDCKEALKFVELLSASSNERSRQHDTTEKLKLLIPQWRDVFKKDFTEDVGYLVTEQTEDQITLTKASGLNNERKVLKNVQILLFDHLLALMVKGKIEDIIHLEDATMTQTPPNDSFTVNDGHGTTVEFQGIFLKPHYVAQALEETSFRKKLAKSTESRHDRRSNAVRQSSSSSGVVDPNDNSVAASSNTQQRQRRNAFVKLATPDQPTL